MKTIESLALQCEGTCKHKTNHKFVKEYQTRTAGKVAVVYRCEKCDAMNVLYKTIGWRRYE